ncbi:MAG: ammonia-forming cytochrome c nitrite reductase subunit c552 [Eubacteriales bacterium]
MDYFAKKQWIRIAVCAVLVAAITLAMTGVFSGGKQLAYQDKSVLAEEEAENGGNAQSEMLQAIVVSMGNESKNDYVTDYLKQDPYLVNIYEGYGFAKDYGSARGHAYTLEDVQKTERPHAKANCLTCKTPDMHKMIEEQGVGVYSMPFDDVMAQTTNTISCYTCHGADDGNNGQMVVTHQYVNEALGENVSTVNAASLSCGQCHIEYYFTPEDSEAMMPYHSIEEMTPEAILAYYDGMGFSDWEQPGTGTKMLKAQHPELETWIQGRHASILSCADCHMPVKTTESGTEYHDHHLVSPLSSEAILNKCAECHGSGEAITARVREIQAKITGRETEVGNRLSSLKDTLTAAVEAGQISGEELDAVRKLHREAQWFFDFCYVENSEGAHNSSLATRCLDTSDGKITEAFAMLASAGVEVASEAMSGKQEEAAPSDGSVTEQGFGGDVTVRLVLNEDGTVKEMIIETPNETEGLGKRASEAEFAEQFIGKTPPFAFGEDGIEALSGATVTSTAVMTAINKAAAASASGETAGTNAAGNGVTEQGFGGEVTVIVELNEDGTIKTLTIDTPNETEGLGKRASEAEFTEQFIGKSAPFAFGENGIEALSGATVTSTAVLTAINKAAAGPAAEETTEEKSEEPAEEPKEEEKTEEPETEEKREEPAVGEKTEEKAETAASGGQVYGVYRATKTNDYSKVTVTIGAKNGAMTSCKIASEGEQDLLTDEIRNEWAKAILESGSAAPDAITGATLKVSAQSVQDAVTDILAQMNSEAAAVTETAEKAEEPKEEEKTEEPETEEKREEPAVGEKTEEKAETAASGGQVYGVYRATKTNDYSKVTVTIGAKNGAMTSCKIASEGEQDLLTDEIRNEWAKAILESGSAAPDAITGATLKVSAQSVQDAVTEILGEIDGK